MTFQVGDKVTHIDQNFIGIIKEISSNGILLIEDEYGFDFHYTMDEVVLVDSSKYEKVYVSQFKEFDITEEKKKAQKRKKHIPVVDLHMENLVSSHTHMSNHEIVMFQLEHFKKKLDVYTKRGIREFIVVHGIGSGKLKAEVRYILNGYPKLEYMDDHISGYGVGATRVFIK